jgi:hypothetical protein
MVTVQTKSKDQTTTDILAQTEAPKAQNAKLKEARNARISYKASEQAALSVYGLGQFPVTLYRGQWERLFAVADEIKKFIMEDSARLAEKA